MSKRLQEAEKVIERLQRGNISPEAPPLEEGLIDFSSAAWNMENESSSALHDAASSASIPRPRAFSQANFSAELLDTALSTDASSRSQNRRPSELSRPGLPLLDSRTSDNMQEDPTAINLSLDQNGEICYYGPTSALHDPPGLDAPSPRSSAYGSVSTRTNVREYLSSHAKESTIWEQFALGNAAIQTGIPQQVMAKLLQMHFTWVAPMFMWVYRPAFMRMYS
jgi:hypothetical protein